MHLRWISLPESKETTCFQFQAVAGMIFLSVPFWCSFSMLNGLSEQRGDLIGSSRVLYEKGVVQSIGFTILPPSQRDWWSQFDNVSTLRGSLGHITILEVD